MDLLQVINHDYILTEVYLIKGIRATQYKEIPDEEEEVTGDEY